MWYRKFVSGSVGVIRGTPSLLTEYWVSGSRVRPGWRMILFSSLRCSSRLHAWRRSPAGYLWPKTPGISMLSSGEPSYCTCSQLESTRCVMTARRWMLICQLGVNADCPATPCSSWSAAHLVIYPRWRLATLNPCDDHVTHTPVLHYSKFPSLSTFFSWRSAEHVMMPEFCA